MWKKAAGRRSRGEEKSATSSVALRRVESALDLLGVARFHADALDVVPTSYLQLAGWSILWTRACTILPPAVLYGGAMTSRSPVSSASRRRPEAPSGGSWGRRCSRLALLLGARSSHHVEDAVGRRDGIFPVRTTSRPARAEWTRPGMISLQDPGRDMPDTRRLGRLFASPGEPDGRQSLVYALKDQSVRGNG